MARKFRAGLLSVWKSALDFISRIPSSEQGVRFGSYADKKCFNKLTQDVRDGIHLRNRPRKRFPGRIVGSFAYKNDKWLSRMKKRNIKQTLLFSGLKGWADEAAALIQNYFFLLFWWNDSVERRLLMYYLLILFIPLLRQNVLLSEWRLLIVEYTTVDFWQEIVVQRREQEREIFPLINLLRSVDGRQIYKGLQKVTVFHNELRERERWESVREREC